MLNLEGIAGRAVLAIRIWATPTSASVGSVNVAAVRPVVPPANRAFHFVGVLIGMRRARQNTADNPLTSLIHVAGFRTHFLPLSFWNFDDNH
jgi:hypothetical protein